MKQDDLKKIVSLALKEDIGTGDITASLIPTKTLAMANIISREDAVFCGQEFVDEIFRRIDKRVEINWQVQDGALLHRNQIVASIKGPARSLLIGERTAINFIQTLSATATLTKKIVDAVAHTKVKILDTRKTLPGLRLAQKHAVLCGGGKNHRLGLYDAFLIKENHIRAVGSIKLAIERARELDSTKTLEIEVTNLKELKEALLSKPDIIMLDNFGLTEIKKAVAINNGLVKLEVSGNVRMTNVKAIAETGVDYISIGALTKNIKAVDLSMKFTSQ